MWGPMPEDVVKLLNKFLRSSLRKLQRGVNLKTRKSHLKFDLMPLIMVSLMFTVSINIPKLPTVDQQL